MPIESGMLTVRWRGPEKVETYYYDIRKQVFEYDEVTNNNVGIRTPAGAGRPRPQEAGDRLWRAHHGRDSGGLCESRSAA